MELLSQWLGAVKRTHLAQSKIVLGLEDLDASATKHQLHSRVYCWEFQSHNGMDGIIFSGCLILGALHVKYSQEMLQVGVQGFMLPDQKSFRHYDDSSETWS